jgi:hypothetical protein
LLIHNDAKILIVRLCFLQVWRFLSAP